MTVDLTIVGSINLDLVACVERLPRPGETISGATFERFPGGKGANQAVAAAQLGAPVRLIGAVGTDPPADEALAGLLSADVELELDHAGTTGIALIIVAADGENQIIRVPGANASVRPVSARRRGALPARGAERGVVLAAARGASLLRLERSAGTTDRRRCRTC